MCELECLISQLWIFIGRIDTKDEAPILWLPDAESRLTGEDLDVGSNWRQKEKGVAEDEMVRYYHWLSWHVVIVKFLSHIEHFVTPWTAAGQTSSPSLAPESELKVTQSCSILCDPMDYTVHEILQARILEWVAFSFSRGSSQPRNWTQVFLSAGEFFTRWVTREAQEFWSR